MPLTTDRDAPLPVLRTKRLVLTPLLASDAAAMFPELQDPQLYEFLDVQPPQSEAEVADRYRQLERREAPDRDERWWNWILRRGESDAPLGYIQATIAADSLALIAYVVFRRHQGQGYATEAAVAVLQRLVDVGIEQFLARVDPRNLVSQRLLTRLGFAVASSGTSPGTDLIFAADSRSLVLDGSSWNERTGRARPEASQSSASQKPNF